MAAITDPLEAYCQLWASGRPTELDAFLRDVGPLPPSQLAAVVRMDQRWRWQAAQSVEAFSTVKHFKC